MWQIYNTSKFSDDEEELAPSFDDSSATENLLAVAIV